MSNQSNVMQDHISAKCATFAALTFILRNLLSHYLAEWNTSLTLSHCDMGNENEL